MGYTHYFEHRAVTDEVWEKITADCKKLYENLPDEIEIVTGNGDFLTAGWNEIESTSNIMFNGVREGAHETFHLQKKGSSGFEFCKTAAKPYDLLVCSCLIAYLYHSDETIDLDSDGSMKEWEDAVEFVKEVLGAEYSMKFIMTMGDVL